MRTLHAAISRNHMQKNVQLAIGIASALILVGAGCRATQEATFNPNPAPSTPETTQPASTTSPVAPAAPASSASPETTSTPSAELKSDVKADVKVNVETKTPTTPTAKKSAEPSPEPKPSVPAPQAPVVTAPTVKAFTVIAKNWTFEPSTIRVKKGDTVTLSIKSVDVDHGFALSAFNINKKLVPGQTTQVEFVADKTGSFSFFCSVFCGSGHSGMRGTLVVEE